MIVIFKSAEKNYLKERDGLKPNTLREIGTDERFYKLDRKLKEWQTEPTHICIENTQNGEHFIRKIVDITRFKDMLIISWEKEK